MMCKRGITPYKIVYYLRLEYKTLKNYLSEHFTPSWRTLILLPTPRQFPPRNWDMCLATLRAFYARKTPSVR